MNPRRIESVSCVAGEVSAVRDLHDTGYRTTELACRCLVAVGHCVGLDRTGDRKSAVTTTPQPVPGIAWVRTIEQIG